MKVMPLTELVFERDLTMISSISEDEAKLMAKAYSLKYDLIKDKMESGGNYR